MAYNKHKGCASTRRLCLSTLPCRQHVAHDTYVTEKKDYRIASRFKNLFTKDNRIVILLSNQQLE